MTPIILIIIWIAMTFFNVSVAREAKYNPLIAFLVSVFFPVISFAAYALIKRDLRKKEKDNPKIL